MDTQQNMPGGTNELTFTKITCEHIYGNTHIPKVGHYETRLQLVTASRINIII